MKAKPIALGSLALCSSIAWTQTYQAQSSGEADGSVGHVTYSASTNQASNPVYQGIDGIHGFLLTTNIPTWPNYFESFDNIAYGTASANSDGSLHAGCIANSLDVDTQTYTKATASASISGTGTLTGNTTITTAPFNFGISGDLTTSHLLTSDIYDLTQGSATIAVGLTIVNNSNTTSDTLTLDRNGLVSDSNGLFSNLTSSAAFAAGFTPDGNGGSNVSIQQLYTNPISLVAGQVSVTLSLTATTTGGVGPNGVARKYGGGLSDFANTLSFTTQGPALGLASGWNFNSSAFRIVNNRYTPTPEPSALAVLAVGALGLLARRRRI